MNKKIFAVWLALCAAVMSFQAKAVTLPVHHQYVWHETPSSNDIYNYDMHVVWHQEPDASTMGFYAQFAFYFQNGTVGYMGLQKDSSGKKAIFSIWDADTQTLARGMVAPCQRFGHEGSGASCITPFNWQPGREYKLRVWRLGSLSPAGKEQWGGWVIDYATGEETLIGIIEVDNHHGLSGYGSLSGSTVATMENYQSGNQREFGCSQMPYFSASWFGPFANNGSRQAIQATPSFNTAVGNPCTQNSNVAPTTLWVNFSEVGPSVVRTAEEGKNLWAHYGQRTIDQTECLYNWAETVLPAVYDQSKFRHRRLSRSTGSMYYRDYTVNGQGVMILTDMATGYAFVKTANGPIETIGPQQYWVDLSACGH